ncbi:MAG: bifunctional adenosylcobinamide kinase/adenosylcobinamide-phosphate guanylyltransferase [Desulfopila sp.]
MKRVVLITGGARSGKSSYALRRCEEHGGERCFVATCPVIDPEMDERIIAHKRERAGRGWDCVEEETGLARLLPSLHRYQTVLIDCLTLWVNNLMYSAQRNGQRFAETEMRGAAEQLIAAIDTLPGLVCLVTNEVGLGIVPDNATARKYRDLVGSCNRYLASRADEVILVSCGLPLVLKE